MRDGKIDEESYVSDKVSVFLARVPLVIIFLKKKKIKKKNSQLG